MLPDDLLHTIAVQLSFSDLCALCAASKRTKALVTAFLEREYGERFERYRRCSKFAHPKTHATLMRFASPMTLRPWSYRCAGCGRKTATVGSCPICAFERFTFERRRTENVLELAVNIIVAAYCLLYCALLSESDSMLLRFSCVLCTIVLGFGSVGRSWKGHHGVFVF